MKLHRIYLSILVLFCSVAARAGQVEGKILDPQGNPVPGATVRLEAMGSPVGNDADAALVVQSLPDGSYRFPDVDPGQYRIVVERTGFAVQRQGPVEIRSGGPSRNIDLRMTPARQAETVRGAEERNPNDFIILLDTNGILNELARTGASLRFVTEFRSDQNLYGEPFGRPLRLMNFVAPSRSIASGFHGSLYEFHQNHTLNARPYFQVGELLPSRRNQYGFNVVGPIVPDKLAVSFAWGQVRDSGFVNGNVQVPLADERTPQAANPEDNAIIAALLSAYPDDLPNLPHVSPRHLNTSALRDIKSTAFSIRVDSDLNENNRLSFLQQFQDSTEDPFELIIGQNPQTNLRPQSYQLTLTRVHSPRTILNLSLNYERLGALLVPTGRYTNLLAHLGVPNIPDFSMGDEISNVGMPGQGLPRWRFENHYILSPRITHTRGRHVFSAGASFTHLRDSDLRTSNGRGTLSFRNDFDIFDESCGCSRTATAVENFLLGRPSRLSLSVGSQYQGYRNWNHIAYFQDRFQATDNLLLSFGLRYEMLALPREDQNLFEFQHDADANNIAPQFGFAWNPRGAGIVLRGGFGVAFAPLTLSTWKRQASNPPLIFSLSVDEPPLSVARDIPFLVPDPNRRSGTGSLDKEAALPYAYIYNFGLEREMPAGLLIRAGYQGSRGHKGFVGLSLNRAVPVEGIESATGTVNRRRPNPDHLRIYNIVNATNNYLDAFQLSVAQRRTRGLAFDLRYSFAKTIDSGVFNFADNGNGGDTSQSELLFPDVRAVSDFDTPHSLTINYSYEIPSLRLGPSWVDRAFSQWTVSGTTTFRSGTPFSLFTGSDGAGIGNVDGESGDRPNILDTSLLGRSIDDPDTSRAILGAETCTPAGAEASDGSATPYIRCAGFDTNLPVGGRGSIGLRTFRKDGTDNWNFAIARNFPLSQVGEAHQVQFRAEFFNFFNHAQFSAPGDTVSSPTFGQITNTVNKGRVSQVSLRYVF